MRLGRRHSCLVGYMRIWVSGFMHSLLMALKIFFDFQWIKQLNSPLEEIDPEIADIIELEKARQWKVRMIQTLKKRFF